MNVRLIPHLCKHCGEPQRVIVPDNEKERVVIEAAREWAVRPGIQRRIDALTDALEALEREEK